MKRTKLNLLCAFSRKCEFKTLLWFITAASCDSKSQPMSENRCIAARMLRSKRQFDADTWRILRSVRLFKVRAIVSELMFSKTKRKCSLLIESGAELHSVERRHVIIIIYCYGLSMTSAANRYLLLIHHRFLNYYVYCVRRRACVHVLAVARENWGTRLYLYAHFLWIEVQLNSWRIHIFHEESIGFVSVLDSRGSLGFEYRAFAFIYQMEYSKADMQEMNTLAPCMHRISRSHQ